LAAIAGRQKGIVTRDQLLAAGLSVGRIKRLIRSGHLIPVHRGIYLVGHRAVHPLAYETAAILACRPRAMLSHHTASRLMKLAAPKGGKIHVTLLGRWRPAPSGVAIHTISTINRNELHRHDGLPITSPSLTILDMAGVLATPDLIDLLNEARVQRRITDAQLHATLDAHPKRRGARALGKLLASEYGPKITQNKAERRALTVMRAHGHEPDATQHPIGPYRVDFYFEAERLAVELDSRQFHDTPKRFQEDRRRTAYLAAEGVQVFPLTWQDLHGDQVAAMDRLRRAREARR
jgi:very-short-patch-repair endonuclease